MGKRIGGQRRKTRYKLRKQVRDRGKVAVTRYFQEFKEGERVHLILESSVTKGMFHPRFHGKNGVVKGMKGHCYEILIKDQDKPKMIIAHPVHLKKVENGQSKSA